MPKFIRRRAKESEKQFPTYFNQLNELEVESEPFKKNLITLNGKFHDYLLSVSSKGKTLKTWLLIELFIEFLCSHTKVRSLQEVTKDLINPTFINWYKNKVLDNCSDLEITTAIKKFFLYLNDHEEITNQELIGSYLIL